MIIWVVVLVMVVAIFLVLRLKHFRHKLYAVIVIILLLFVYTTFTVVAEQYKMDFKTTEGFFLASKVYFSWLGNSFSNLKVLTGNAFKMDWKINKTLEG